MTSLADKLQNLELCLESRHDQEVSYGRALREAIACMDLFIEVEVLKSLGDLHLQKGKLGKDSGEIDKAAALYAAALLRCKDRDMGQTLEHRIDYMEKLSRQLLQGYTPHYRWLSSDYWGTASSNVLRVAEICDKLDRSNNKSQYSVEETYTETLVTAIENSDMFLELEVLKSLGDFYLEKGRKSSDETRFSKAAAMYEKALTRCEDPETKQTLHHRICYAENIKEAVKMRPPSNESRPGERNSPMGHQFGNITRPEDHPPPPDIPRMATGEGKVSNASTAAQENDDSTYEEHLQQGCQALQTGDLGRAEQSFATALKSVHVKGQHREEAEPLYRLGDVYLKRGVQSIDGGDFTKAAALCNAALVRLKREDIEEAIQDITQSFVKHVLNIDKKAEINDAEKHKLMLKKDRDYVEREIKMVDNKIDPYSLDDDDPELREVEGQRVEAIKILFQTIVHQRNTFIAGLIDECIEVMGPPPCRYAMVGLGSQATGLVTPYSDLEFAILVEEDTEHNATYFRNLTHYLHLKVINLGETILPAMGIKSLNNFYSDNPLDSWYYDSVTPRGFSFDGAMPHACKTPLGRGEKGRKTKSELIQTPSNMTKVLHDDFTFHLKKGYHLASILGNVSLITGEQGLVDEYMSLCTQQLQENNGKILLEMANTSLTENAPTFQVKDLTARLLNVKKEMYRFSSLAVFCWALLHNMQPTTIWETIQELNNGGVVSNENAHHLMVLVSISAELRLRTYMGNGGQVENMSVLSSLSKDTDIGVKLKKVFYFSNTKQLLRYYYRARPLKHFISQLSGSEPEEAPSIFFNNSSELKAEVYESLCDYENFQIYTDQTLQNKLVEHGENTAHPDIARSLNKLGTAWTKLGDHRKAVGYYEQSLQMKHHIYGEDTAHPQIAYTLGNLGVAYNDLGDHRKAVRYHEQSLQMYRSIYGEGTVHIDIADSLNLMGNAWTILGDHRKAINYYEQSLQMMQSIYGVDTVHPHIASSLNNLGAVWSDLGDYRKAINYYQQSLKMNQGIYGEDTVHPEIASYLNNLGVLWGKLGDCRKAVSYYNQSLQMRRRIYGENTAHPDIADTLNNLGVTWVMLGDYKNAISHYEESLQMKRSIYGEGTAHTDIAFLLNNLGTAWRSLADNKKAISYYKQSLQIKRSIYGENTAHPDITTSLNNLGNVYTNLGDHRKAVSYYEQSLQMRQNIYCTDTVHPYIADSLNNLGSALSNLGDHRKAVSYHEQALQMRQSIYGENTAHPDIASSLINLGNAWSNLGDCRKAVEYYGPSLEMYRVIYGEDTAHPDIASLLNNMGVAWLKLGDPRKAVNYHEQSLQMRRNVYGEDTAHPDIVASLINLGIAWGKLRDYSKAVSYYQQSLKMRRSIHGENTAHPDIEALLNTTALLNNLGRARSDLGDNRKATCLIS
ncbi:uncharacterized protein [Branchiostoma lanceolatum]|uniref:uncharacterized protein n=1 Tax=Branchiostoma lanceolatum TaxID=7740 RepID=UPI0034543187